MKGFLPGSMAAVLMLVARAAGAAAPQTGSVFERLTLVVPGSPGGGWDQTARVMQRALVHNGLARRVEVRNSPGGGGIVGLAQFVSGEKGRGDVLLVGGQVMINAVRTNRATISLADTIPIARLTGDYEVIAVPTGSELRTLKDLVQALRVQPGAVSWGGASSGRAEQTLINAVGNAIGVDPARMNYVPFSGGGEVAEALMQHEIMVGVSGYGEFAPRIGSGGLRALGISSKSRLYDVDIPTLREQGVDVTIEGWRGVFAPPEISVEQSSCLSELVAAMVRTAAWREGIREHRLSDQYLAGEAFAKFLDGERARAAQIAASRGLNRADRPDRVWTREMLFLRNRNVALTLVALAALAIVILILWQRRAAARREQELFRNLEAARQDAALASAEVQNLLSGLCDQIDRQFTTWGFTAAEREIALLMLKGLRHKEIASIRQTGERTVRQQALAIYKKAGLDGRTDLAAFFLEDLLQPAAADSHSGA
jgi:putative tricarboxylic transport membrane protein